MTHDVFISHSSKDKTMADAICAGLEARGIRCWISPRDVLPGQNYAGQLYQAIETCRVFLLLLTENAILSSHILKEVESSIQSGVTILPFRIQDIPLSDDLKYYLSNVHWLDALTPPFEKHIESLADYINRLIERPLESQPQNDVEQTIDHVTSNPPMQALSRENQSEMNSSAAMGHGISHRKDVNTAIPSSRVPSTPEPNQRLQKSSEPSLIWKFLKFAIGAIALVTLAVGSVSGWFTRGRSATPTGMAEILTTETITNKVTGFTGASTATPLYSPALNTPAPVITMQSQIDGATMVYVPAGEFLMGSLSGEGNDDEHPLHPVYLDAYWIGQTEVTNGTYAKCITAGVCSEPHDGHTLRLVSYPVNYVALDQAQIYCEWTGGRLPTEAEWEKAARGTDGRTYPWGNEFDCSKGNFDDEASRDASFVEGGLNCDGYADTAPVGSYPSGASPYGALDMAGNLWEWVLDRYGKYSSALAANPTGPSIGDKQVLRGGSWFSTELNVRSAVRSSIYSSMSQTSIGFRCVLEE